MQSFLQPAFNKHRVIAYAHYAPLFPGVNPLNITNEHYQFSRLHSVSLLAFPYSRWSRTGAPMVPPAAHRFERNFASVS
jgi:hypothetical protein